MERFNNLPQSVKLVIIGVSILLVSVSLSILFLHDSAAITGTLPASLLHEVPTAPPN